MQIMEQRAQSCLLAIDQQKNDGEREMFIILIHHKYDLFMITQWPNNYKIAHKYFKISEREAVSYRKQQIAFFFHFR